MLSPAWHAWVLAAATALGLLAAVDAATVTYDFNVTWVPSNPDGLFERPTIGINGQWPVPQITATVGDNVVVHVTNLLGNESTSLHFHGLYMNGTTHMDGAPQVSQCEILPGLSFTYNFTITQPGTYWYHSHSRGQYPDGLRGALVIQDPASPYLGRYDQEVVLSVSDWYHDLMSDLIPGFLSKANPTGAEPVPDAVLFNDTKNLSIRVEPGKTYLFRMVNIGAFSGNFFWIENHTISIVEVDGVYTQPAEADLIYLTTAQRYSFLLTTKNETSANYAFVGSMDTSLFDALPDGLDYNVTGWLVYDEAKPLPSPALVSEFQPFDDMTLVPYDNQTLLRSPDQVVELDVIMDNLGDGANYAFFNNITYTAPKVPTLYTALTAGDLASNPTVYGGYTNAFVLEKGQVVQITVNNLDTGRHPFHLHGHHFQAVYRSAEDAGTFADANVSEDNFPRIPMRRDTVLLYPRGNLVLRFRADNPGVWLFHCHIEWHVVSGLVATFVEAPRALQETLTVPQNHYDVCAAGHVPVVGNAAAHSVDWLDLGGQPAAKPPLPDGFTTRGIVALVFSCLSGLLGVIIVAWYGLVPDPLAQQHASEVSSDGANRSMDASPMAKEEPVVSSSPAQGSGQMGN